MYLHLHLPEIHFSLSKTAYVAWGTGGHFKMKTFWGFSEGKNRTWIDRLVAKLKPVMSEQSLPKYGNFRVGDKVDKVKGYSFPGVVVAVYQTLKGETRYVVELEGYGLQHIFTEVNLIGRK